MSYTEWFNEHADKHKKIVDKLLARGYGEDEIIEYFDFENMVKEENDFCPLYKEPVKCHDIEKLNCYLCGCPHFRFNDEGLGEYNKIKILSKCDINNGSKLASGGAIHQDCSKCTVPHHKAFVKKRFDTDWRKIMRECTPDEA
ncbi:MAG: hypothetical protein WCY51_02455 [Sulfurimonas sp.]|uniref:hypothetical protein n=1 Tax=Sulfurimonas sp. TaxID=2022749 RepID=UPI0025FDC89A|nr:hypothetical protein [Sulfurimonas sp.]MCK9453755.1 cysteine-rich small domain-containing protein [Sulfurimonas sp.]